MRAVGVSLPDASLVWNAFMQMVSKMSEESSTIEHYMQYFLLKHSVAILAKDETHVLQMVQIAYSWITIE